jgi:hypothetical protein
MTSAKMTAPISVYNVHMIRSASLAGLGYWVCFGEGFVVGWFRV